VVEGATHYYPVRAEDDGTPSGWSDPVSTTFTTVPAATASLTGTVTGPVSGPVAGISLNWTNTTGRALVTHMEVQRATDPGFTTGLADFPLGAATTSYTDTGGSGGHNLLLHGVGSPKPRIGLRSAWPLQCISAIASRAPACS
jgi:hypothetical protein